MPRRCRALITLLRQELAAALEHCSGDDRTEFALGLLRQLRAQAVEPPPAERDPGPEVS